MHSMHRFYMRCVYYVHSVYIYIVYIVCIRLFGLVSNVTFFAIISTIVLLPSIILMIIIGKLGYSLHQACEGSLC